MNKKSDHNNHIIIDFDSTFTQVEALDILCEISQFNNPNSGDILRKIETLTNQGMAGEIPLRESLNKRIGLLEAHNSHISSLITILKNRVTNSFMENLDFLLANSSQIYIVSNGFKEFITPVVVDYGIKPSHIFANDFTFGLTGNIEGINLDNQLSRNKGKSSVVKSLELTGKIHIIGDGYTDYEIKKEGVGHVFYAFVENIYREQAVNNADYIIKDLNQFIEIFNSKYSN